MHWILPVIRRCIALWFNQVAHSLYWVWHMSHCVTSTAWHGTESWYSRWLARSPVIITSHDVHCTRWPHRHPRSQVDDSMLIAKDMAGCEAIFTSHEFACEDYSGQLVVEVVLPPTCQTWTSGWAFTHCGPSVQWTPDPLDVRNFVCHHGCVWCCVMCGQMVVLCWRVCEGQIFLSINFHEPWHQRVWPHLWRPTGLPRLHCSQTLPNSTSVLAHT